jgi:Peptidase A4 family
MLTKRLLILGAVAIAPAFPQASFTPVSSQATTQVSRHQHHAPARIRERHDDGTVTSTNWSGYAATGAAGSVTLAKGSWTVPTVDCSGLGRRTDQYAAFWVGIDGYTSDTVEQTGTDSDCDGSTPSYYAWYEFYPEPSFDISSLDIEPGDQISAEVGYGGSGGFTIKITDERTGQTFTKSAKVASAQRSSAEWIAEAPSSITGVLPLSDFGTVLFGEDNTSITQTCFALIGGVGGPIGSFSSVDQITMQTSSGANEAVPSALSSDKSSFSVTWFSN